MGLKHFLAGHVLLTMGGRASADGAGALRGLQSGQGCSGMQKGAFLHKGKRGLLPLSIAVASDFCLAEQSRQMGGSNLTKPQELGPDFLGFVSLQWLHTNISI